MSIRARIHKATRAQYAAIPNSIAQSRTLSPAARAVLIELLSRPDDWETRPAQLAYEHLSVRTVYRVLNELIDAGYVTRTAVRGDEGKIAYWRYDVFSEPLAKTDEVVVVTNSADPERKRRAMRARTHYVANGTHTKKEEEERGTNAPLPGSHYEPPAIRVLNTDTAPPLTDQQKAVRLLAQFHEAKTGSMVAGWARRDMDALIEDFPLARLEAAIAATGDQPMAKPFLYLRKVLASADLLPAPPPARPAGRSDAAGNGTGWQLVEAFVSIGRPADQVSEAAQAMWSSYKVRQDAAQLARLGATPEDVKALVQSKMADGRDGYSFRFLVTDMVEWKAARPPVVERMYFTAPDEPAPRMTDAERAALKLQIAAVRRESAS